MSLSNYMKVYILIILGLATTYSSRAVVGHFISTPVNTMKKVKARLAVKQENVNPKSNLIANELFYFDMLIGGRNH